MGAARSRNPLAPESKGKRQVSTQSERQQTWFADEDGAPMVLISFQMSELVGLPNYSNVVIGPASVTRFVCEDDVEAGYEKCYEDVEHILGAKRDLILETLQKAAQDS